MRLALLGTDLAIQTLLRDLPAEHQIVAVYEAREDQLPLGALLPGVERSAHWESLLVREDVDLVIVADRHTTLATADGLDPHIRRVDQLKKLAQAGKSLLITHPACDVLDAYEIELLRREGGGCIVPWFPGMNHPAWEELPRVSSTEAPPLQITWERRVASLTRTEVLSALARDLMLITRVVGKLKRVTALAAMSAGESPQDWQTLSVQLEAEDRSLVRWTVARPSVTFSCRAVVEEGLNPWELQASVNINEPWLLRERGSNSEPDVDLDWQEANATFANFAQIRSSPEATADAWLEGCRALETLAAVEKSLQRSRTIELPQTEQTEEHQFKGVMASAGCLLLLLMLLAVFVVALVEGLQLPLRKSVVWRAWPLALIVPLAIFLALQFLQTIIQKPPTDQKTESV